MHGVVTNEPEKSSSGARLQDPTAGATGVDPGPVTPPSAKTGTAAVTDAGPGRQDAKQVPLEVVDLTKHFRSGFLRRRIRGIEGVSFTVPAGGIFALLGHNGAGKTTTLHCVLDLVHADRGRVRLFGADHRGHASRARIGYLPERPYFFEHLTGGELLEFYAKLLKVPAFDRKRHVRELAARVGMTRDLGRRLGKYSKGMLQRIGIAQALLGDPELLILDEPMSGLDPLGRREVRELLLELKRAGKTIILSSHIVPDVEMLADTVAVLREGRLVETSELGERTERRSYEVRLVRPDPDGGADLAAVVLAAELQVPVRTTHNGRLLCVEAEDTTSLRRLLDRCHETGVTVQSVDARCTGLEDLFLAAHDRREVRS